MKCLYRIHLLAPFVLAMTGLALLLILLNVSGSTANASGLPAAESNAAMAVPSAMRLALSAAVRYVAPGGSDTANDCLNSSTPCATVQHAIDIAVPGDEIHIAAGTYDDVNNLGGESQIALITKTLTLRGGYDVLDWSISNPEMNPTVLHAPSAVRVLFITGTISVSVEGLQIIGTNCGFCTGSRGVYVISSTLTLLDNIIEGHSGLSGSGGGLYLRGVNGVIRNNIIRNNYAEFAGAGAYVESSEVSFISNVFENHDLIAPTPYATGGGLYLRNSTATLTGNIFRHNEAGDGAAIYVSGGHATLINNAILDNTLHAPAFRVGEGSGIKSFGAELHLLHNTIARNTGGDGSGINVVDNQFDGIASRVWMTNTILVSQTVGITATVGNTVTVNGVLWSDNVTNTGGTGSISVQNAFTGNAVFAGDGYHLLAGSDAIDQGIVSGVATDIDGETRSGAPDLGADEYVFTMPKLAIPTQTWSASNRSITIPISFTANGSNVSSLAFSMDYDETWLSFDPADGDVNGVPDAVSFNVPAGFNVSASFDAGDTDGELDFVVMDVVSPLVALSDTVLVSVTLQTGVPLTPTEATVGFSSDPSPSFGTTFGLGIAGSSTSGAVLIGGPPASISVTASPTRILADGISTSTVTTLLTDALGYPVPNYTVTFSTTLGTITGPVTTTASGVATATLIAAATTGTATVSADAGGVSGTTTVIFSLPPEVAMPMGAKALSNSTVTIPISYTANANDVSSLIFSLDFDETLLSFDASDGNSDGIPDVVTFNVPGGFSPSVTYDAGDTDGELDFTILDLSPPLASLNSGVLVSVTLQTGAPSQDTEATVAFSSDPSPSFGNTSGQSVAGVAHNGSVIVIGAPGSVTVTANPSSLTADGASTSTITATLKNSAGVLVAGKVVTFSTSLGSVTGSATTNASGVATATLTAATQTGTAIVSASAAGDKAGSTTVTFVAGPPASLSVSASPSSITADGSTSSISAVVRDQHGNPVPNQTVTFATTLGSISSSATTNGSGQATATLTAGTSSGVATVTATAGAASGQTSVTFTSPPVPASVSVLANPSAISVGGGTSTVTGLVRDGSGNPLANQVVSFATTLGIISGSATTNASGEATATLTAATTTGTAIVTATADSAVGTTTVGFVAGPPATVLLAAHPITITANGSSTSVVTATVKDAFDNLVPGHKVVFSTILGTVTSPATTNASGVATATLTAATTTGTAFITATAGSVVDTMTVDFVAGPPASVALVANPASISANGASTSIITATVRDAFHNRVPGVTTHVSTTLGTIPTSVIGDASGVATATLTAGYTAGAAIVTARAGSATGQTTVTLQSDPPQTVSITAPAMGMTGTAGIGYTFTASVDPVFFSRTSDEPAASLPLTYTWRATDKGTLVQTGGFSSTAVFSWTQAGQKVVTVTVSNPAGATTGTYSVTIQPSAPATLLLTADSAQLPADGVSTSKIRAAVRDIYANPTPGRNVAFVTSMGVISPSVQTGTDGNAVATYTAPVAVGRAAITATLGNLIYSLPLTITGGSIHGEVFLDTNRNGTREPNEKGISGAEVLVRTATGIEVGSDVTDTDGNYSVNDLPYRMYTVTVKLPAMYTLISSATFSVQVTQERQNAPSVGAAILQFLPYVDSSSLKDTGGGDGPPVYLPYITD